MKHRFHQLLDILRFRIWYTRSLIMVMIWTKIHSLRESLSLDLSAQTLIGTASGNCTTFMPGVMLSQLFIFVF